jgi:16S rRNA (cytosine1402-N4)-methyltransferase
VGGLVADLGVSSFHLDDPERGFSFSHDGPLDMRLDRTRGRTAADLLAAIDERSLAQLLREGDEPHARRIARAIHERRREEAVRTTRQLAEIVEAVAPRRRERSGPHPATLTFQALRIAVNDELTGLEDFVRDAATALEPRGRLAVLSFHSGEDRAVKHALRGLAGACTCPPEALRCTCGRVEVVRILTRRPLQPGESEVAINPRARSARLRAAERLGDGAGRSA